MEYCIGIDLGGTNIAGGLVTMDGALVLTDSIPTGCPCSAEEIADRIVTLCRQMTDRAGYDLADAAWVGVGVPGSVDTARGIVLYANNLNFRDTPFGDLLQERLQLPVHIDNDANAAAWGEYLAGAGKDSHSMVMVTLGTGIGGGVIQDGQILTGCNGAAAELGHFVIDMHGRECNCGLRGCFEQYGSVTALIEDARAAMAEHPASQLWTLADGDPQRVTGRIVMDASAAGDPTARAVVEAYIHYLCIGVTSIINIFQPEVLCLGGGISRQGDVLIQPLRAYNEAHGYSRGTGPQTQIVAATLYGDAGIIGAALLGKAVANA